MLRLYYTVDIAVISYNLLLRGAYNYLFYSKITLKSINNILSDIFSFFRFLPRLVIID